MNYQLAKKLKDAGFPYNTIPKECHCYVYFVGNEKIWAPSLSDLISECGDRFEELQRVGHKKTPKWTATSFPCEECGWEKMETGDGAFAEEAVANLWLKLNKKT